MEPPPRGLNPGAVDPSMPRMRVAVIGGRGHLGKAAVAGLREQPGLEVVIAGRSSHNDVRVDLQRPESLSALDGFDAVVNCSDSLAAPPDALVERCLRQGPLLLETAGEPVAMRRLLAAFGRPRPGDAGTVLLGAGIFPGFSNLLAAEAIAAVPGCTSIELAMRWNPMSAGGAGMVSLVPHLLMVPTHRVVDGRLVEGPSIGPGPVLPFSDGPHPTLHLAFTEPTMLAHGHPQLREIATYGSVDPDFMTGAFRWVPLWLMQRRIVRAWMWLQFTVLRRGLLRRVSARVRIVARARNPAGDEVVLTHESPDGIADGGRMIAAMLLELAGRALPTGLQLPEALLTAEAIRRRLEPRTPSGPP